MAEVCKLLDIEKTRTSPLHSQSVGQVECFNCTLIEMLNASQEDWDIQLQLAGWLTEVQSTSLQVKP